MEKYRDCKKNNIGRMNKKLTKMVNYRDQGGGSEGERSGEASTCTFLNIVLTIIPFKCIALIF